MVSEYQNAINLELNLTFNVGNDRKFYDQPDQSNVVMSRIASIVLVAYHMSIFERRKVKRAQLLGDSVKSINRSAASSMTLVDFG